MMGPGSFVWRGYEVDGVSAGLASVTTIAAPISAMPVLGFARSLDTYAIDSTYV